LTDRLNRTVKSLEKEPGMAADTRAALISAATDALREDGFAAASARRVAQRAGCNPALVFYHFGSVHELLLAALENVSAERMAAYGGLLGSTTSLAELARAARAVFESDLDSGHVRVLTEMISGAQSVPGLGTRVAAILAPWREFAAAAVRDALAGSPARVLLPADEVAHAVVAGLLGLELLATLDGDKAAALALFDRVRAVGEALDRLRPLAALLGRGNPFADPRKSGDSGKRENGR
jgi:AcrR family transcriptional regulator